MFGAVRDLKTICALATAPGSSAISVIRVSGALSIEVLKKHCISLNKKNIESHKAYFSRFYSYNLNSNHKLTSQEAKLSRVLIDEVLVTFFLDNKSYTGEPSAEISCHGNMLIVQKILNELINSGCSMALPGEFTYRAFLNNKIDLVQAEAVLSLIDSSSDNSLKQSLRQLGGHLSQDFAKIEDSLIWCLAHIEASIDFSTEGIDVVDMSVLKNKLKEILNQLVKLAQSFQNGRLIKDGFKIVLAGQPNVGKSSLLNKFLNEDKAIVTNIAGTTRDVIQGDTIYSGFKFVFADTAGLRETTDIVEKIGVEKSLKEVQSSDVTFFVFDSTSGFTSEDLVLLKQLKGKIILVGNKIDLASVGFNRSEELKKIHGLFLDSGFILTNDILHDETKNLSILNTFFVSSLNSDIKDILLSYIIKLLSFGFKEDEALITSSRQFECLQVAISGVDQTLTELENQVGYEFVSQTLKNSLLNVQEILGKHFDDQVLDRIFKEFCLGK